MDLTTLHQWYYSFIKLFFEEEALERNISLTELIGTVQDPLRQLNESYKNDNISIDYSNPHIRLAYLYYYAPAYAVMTRILWKAYEIGSHSLETLERQGQYQIGFFGAGPATEAIVAMDSLDNLAQEPINRSTFEFDFQNYLQEIGYSGYSVDTRTERVIRFSLEGRPSAPVSRSQVNTMCNLLLRAYPHYSIYRLTPLFRYLRSSNIIEWEDEFFEPYEAESRSSGKRELKFNFFDFENQWVEDRNWLVRTGAFNSIENNGFIELSHCRNSTMDITHPDYLNAYETDLRDLDLYHYQLCMNETLASQDFGTITLNNLLSTFELAKPSARIIIIDNPRYRIVRQRLQEFENLLPPRSVINSFSEPINLESIRASTSLIEDGQLLVRESGEEFPLSHYPVPWDNRGLIHWAKRRIPVRILIVEKN